MKIPNALIYQIIFLAVMLLSLNSPLSFARTDTDLKRDLTSKPEKIIHFAGVVPGNHVLDLFGGGGYYSELLSDAVGEAGEVVLHNNKAYIPYVGIELGKRLADNRLKNVKKLMSESNALQLGEQRFDVIFFVLGYHDLYVSSKDWQVTAEEVIPQAYRALKTGGKLLVIDHAASQGSGSQDAQKFHRIEADFVKADLAKRGFILAKSSDILNNPEDPLNISVFDPSIRRKTHRFVMLFEKKDKMADKTSKME